MKIHKSHNSMEKIVRAISITLMTTLSIVVIPVATYALTGLDIQNSTLTGADIKDGSVLSQDIADGTLTGADIKNNAVYTQDIVDGTLTGSDIKNNSIYTQDIVDSSLTGADIMDGSITGADLGTLNYVNAETLLASRDLIVGMDNVYNIPSNGAGTAAEYTINIANSSSYLGFNCADTDGCHVNMDESSFNGFGGYLLVIHNEGTNPIIFTDEPGVLELSGSFSMGQWDTISLMFRDNGTNESWIEYSRSDN
jgi:hypothetical protein